MTARKHLLFLSPRAADPVVRTLVERLVQGPPAGRPEATAWGEVTTTIAATRGPIALCCQPHAMDRSTLAGVALDDVTGVYVGALPPRVPGLMPAPRAAHGQRLIAQQAADGARDMICAMLAHLARAGRSVLNPPRGGTLLQNKLEHLDRAAALGLQVPPTVVGDDKVAAELAGPAVDKPVRAWTPTVEAVGPLRAGLMRQRHIAGVPTRVLLLDGVVLTAAHIEGTTAIDHRTDPVFSRGDASWRATGLPADVEERLRALLLDIGLRFAGVDFIVNGDGWWFLEANASPVWVEQAERTGADVAGALLATLLA